MMWDSRTPELLSLSILMQLEPGGLSGAGPRPGTR